MTEKLLDGVGGGIDFTGQLLPVGHVLVAEVPGS